MIVGGWQKNSFIDYPGKISCVLFLAGCNFECPYCFNPQLVKTDSTNGIDLKHFFDFLEKRGGMLDGVVISGGEPTLHEDLFLVCQKIRQMGFAIKLDTNGSRPHIIEKLIHDGLIDYIAMDIKTDPAEYPPLIQKRGDPDHILSSIRIIMESTLDYEFRTTCIKPLIDEDIVERIAVQIKGAMLYALQQFQRTKVLNPAFFTERNRCFTDDELSRLRDIARAWVDKCIVR